MITKSEKDEFTKSIIYQQTAESLKNLYSSCKNMQELYLSNLNFIDAKSYAKEFCTVKMSTSRQAGHSYPAR